MADDDIIELYEQGFVGASYDAVAAYDLRKAIMDAREEIEARDAIAKYHLGNTGTGRLVLPYTAAMEIYPECLPGGRQRRGSCVAWCTRNAAMVSYCAHVKYGTDNFVAPEISTDGIENGCFSTDAIYWWRGKDSDGWFCDAAARIAMTKGGLVIRKPYPSVGLDLTKYDPAMEGKWGRKPPPADVADICDNNLVKNITEVKSYEEARDMIANGYALSTCGSEAFAKKRKGPYGICERSSGTWYHAMAIIAGDFRKDTIKKEGPLFLVQNSWGNYLGNSHNTVYGTNQTIPEGSFWARWDDLDRRRIVAIGTSHGWPAQNLPDFGLTDVI